MTLSISLDRRAWIFDLDDTLYPERDFVFSGYRAVGTATRERFGLDISDSLMKRFAAGERGDLFTPVLQMAGMPADEPTVRALVQVYRAHTPQLQPFPDVIPFLKTLNRRSCLIGLISDGWAAVQARKWEALGLGQWFHAVVFTDRIAGQASWKPATAGYEHCLTELGVPPDTAVYVGDNPVKDFITARRLGLATVRLRRPGSEHGDRPALSPAHDADVEAASLAALAATLGFHRL